MATTYHGGGSQSPTSLSKPIERVYEDAQHTGEIQLSCRKLREYPKLAAKYDLVDTISADLSKNRLSEVPKEVCQYVSMEKLNCYHNVIKVIPEALIQLQALTYLNLSRNQLSIIPVFISQMQALEVLIASHNRLVSLPEEIGVLDKLMELDVSCNEISHLPVQIGDLKSLKSLNVRRNFLQELPVEISKLNLRKLDISANRISKIPTLFRKIETLEDIVLENNPLTLPPAHICIKGKQHIMKYLQTEAIREEKKRGILNEQEMKRFRKSLPPQQSVSSEEFRNLMESPDKWKRHTVLSSDSGYSTADSIEKSWSPQETNSHDPQHLIVDGNTQVAKAMLLAAKDQRALPPNPGRTPPEPPQRMNSRLSPDKTPTPTTPTSTMVITNGGQHPGMMMMQPPQPPAPPTSLATTSSQYYRNNPAPPTLYPASSPQTPLTPPTPQGPGPGPGGAGDAGSMVGQMAPSQGMTSQEDVFTRELQRQKQEYEHQKKIAAQLRQQQEEEDEKEHRRRAAQRIQDEQRALLERQREGAEQRAAAQQEAEEARRQEESRQLEEARRAEEAKRAEEARRQEETVARQQDESKLHNKHNNFHNHTYSNKSPDWPPPPSNLTNQHEALSHQELYRYNSYGHNVTGPPIPSQYGSHQRSQQIVHHQSLQNPNLHSPTSPSQYRQFSPSSHGDNRLGSPSMTQYNSSTSQYSPSSVHTRSPSDHQTQSPPYGHGHPSTQGHQPYSPYSAPSHSPRGQYPTTPTSPQGDQSRIISPGHHVPPTSDATSSHVGRYTASQHGRSEHDPYNSMPLDPYSGYRKPALSASNSFKEERRPAGTTQHYRRTTSDSNQRLPGHQPPGGSQAAPQTSMAMTNGPIEEQPTLNGSTPTNQSTDTSPNTSFSSQHSTPSHKSPHVVNGPTSSDTPPDTAPRKPKSSTERGPVSSTTTSRVAKPTAERPGKTTTTTGLTRTGVPTARKTNLMQSEEVRKSRTNLKGPPPSAQSEGQRLKTLQKEASNNYLNRRSTGSTSSEDGKRSTPTRSLAYQSTASSAASSSAASRRAGTGTSTRVSSTTTRTSAATTPRVGVSATSRAGGSSSTGTARAGVSGTTSSRAGTPGTLATSQPRRARRNSNSSTTSVSSTASNRSSVDKSKRSGTVMTTAHVKMLEDYNKDGGGTGASSYGMRRQTDQHRDNTEQMEKLRKTISTRLKRSLPENLSEALSDGVLLCHLANQIRPRSVASVHVPSPAVPKLTPAKCRRNVENFLEACRKIGVSKEQICGSSDILEEKGIGKVAITVSALVAMATSSRHPPATNV